MTCIWLTSWVNVNLYECSGGIFVKRPYFHLPIIFLVCRVERGIVALLRAEGISMLRCIF